METAAQHLLGTESNSTQAESRTQQPSSNLTRSQLAFVAQTIEEDSAKCNSVSSSDCDEAFKQAITRHPLYPLLVMLLRKCDEATQSIEVPSPETIDSEVRTYFNQQDKDWSPMLSDNDETNELMIMALQILRFHLIELRKVQELCDTFCHKYITTLKHKLQADQLPPVYENGDDSDDSGSGSGKSGQFLSHSPDPSILAARSISERHSKLWSSGPAEDSNRIIF